MARRRSTTVARTAPRHGAGGRARHAHARLQRPDAQAAGAGRRQGADRPRARPAGGRPASTRAVVNVHHLADQIERHLAGARDAADRHLRRARANCSAPAAASVKALPQLGDGPFFLVNSDTIWIDGVKPNLARLAAAFDPRAWTRCCCWRRPRPSIGYAGRGDFSMAADGRLTRRGERDVVPFVYAGAAILTPAFFAGVAGRAVLDVAAVRPRRSRPAGCYGLRLDGVWMHVGTPEAVAGRRSGDRRQRGVARQRTSRPFPRSRAPATNGLVTARHALYDSPWHSPRVFTIPASAPFVPTLIRALLDGTLVEGFPAARDPLALAGATLYLPTRRACRLARDLFLDVTGDERRDPAAHRPDRRHRRGRDRLRAGATGGIAATRSISRTALGGLERRLLLTQLVPAWAASPAVRTAAGDAPLVANNPGRRARARRRSGAADGRHDHAAGAVGAGSTRWCRTSSTNTGSSRCASCKIAREAWPAILAERGKIEPAARRDLLIEAEAQAARRPARRPGDRRRLDRLDAGDRRR